MALLEKNPKVLIYDLQPDTAFTEDALEVIRRIRPNLPVIVLAGESRIRQGARLLELGVFYLLPKPVCADTLKTLVNSALEKAKKISL